MGINQEDIKLDTEPEKVTADPAAAAAAYEKQAEAMENPGEVSAGEDAQAEAPGRKRSGQAKG